MAEMLVRVVDKINGDFYLNCQCTKRADVIVVQADNWNWGRMELTDPHYRIVRILGYPLTAAQTYTVPEMPTDPNNPSKTLQKRQYYLDLAHTIWPANFAAWLADDSRSQPILQVVFANVIQTMGVLKVTKPPIQDPAVFGSPSNVIG